MAKKICETSISVEKNSMVVCACHPSYGTKYKIGGWWSRLAWAKARAHI
jgi:hypothetical protein